MGVKYSASESAQLIEAMTNNVQIANEITDRLSGGCNHLLATVDSGELRGEAYTAATGLFTDVIIPSISKIQAAVDDIQVELDSYKTADATISSYGNLDLEQLKEIKKTWEKQLALVKEQIKEKENFWNKLADVFTLNINSLVTQTNMLKNAQTQIEASISNVDEKIQKLEFFVSQVSQYFTDSLEVLNLAIQGATQLSQILVASDGSYSIEGLDMSWVAQMQSVEIKSVAYDSSKDSKKMHKDYQSALDKLQSGERLSDKDFRSLDAYAHRYPNVELPKVAEKHLKKEIANRSDSEKVNKKIEGIKKSDKNSKEKIDAIVKVYEDYLFYTNREAFEEYWTRRRDYKGVWDIYSEDTYVKETEHSLYVAIQGTGIKKIVAKMGNDVLEVKDIEDARISDLIQKGRSLWQSPGDNGSVDNSIAVGLAVGNTVSSNLDFIDLVNTNEALDLKNRAYSDNYSFSIWGRQWEEEMGPDYMGNYFFGYVGKGYLESSDEYLKFGAGVAQGISDKKPLKYLQNIINGNWGDNEGDAKTIQDGMDAYKGTHK